MFTEVTGSNVKDSDIEKNGYQYILQRTHDLALMQNAIQTKRWQEYQKDHEELSSRLLSFRDKLSYSVMVPIGKKALMKGYLVHTNEILVCLGDGWFTKRSAKEAVEICHRRIKYCDQILKKLKKEEELFISRKSFTFESEAFSGGDSKEIIEPYDEEAEKIWRERHREKEKTYRLKLAELKKANSTKIHSEKDLWQKLDALDLQEELEDELNRMHQDNEDESGESTSDSFSESSQECDSQQIDTILEDNKKGSLKRRVSFKEVEGNLLSENNSESDTKRDNCDNRIMFKHSVVSPLDHALGTTEINNPSDIYNQYLRQKTLKSILKPTPVLGLSPQNTTYPNTIHVEKTKQSIDPPLKAVGEVVERTTDSTSKSQNERPISRFKAARIASKR